MRVALLLAVPLAACAAAPPSPGAEPSSLPAGFTAPGTEACVPLSQQAFSAAPKGHLNTSVTGGLTLHYAGPAAACSGTNRSVTCEVAGEAYVHAVASTRNAWFHVPGDRVAMIFSEGGAIACRQRPADAA